MCVCGVCVCVCYTVQIHIQAVLHACVLVREVPGDPGPDPGCKTNGLRVF